MPGTAGLIDLEACPDWASTITNLHTPVVFQPRFAFSIASFPFLAEKRRPRQHEPDLCPARGHGAWHVAPVALSIAALSMVATDYRSRQRTHTRQRASRRRAGSEAFGLEAAPITLFSFRLVVTPRTALWHLRIQGWLPGAGLRPTDCQMLTGSSLSLRCVANKRHGT